MATVSTPSKRGSQLTNGSSSDEISTARVEFIPWRHLRNKRGPGFEAFPTRSPRRPYLAPTTRHGGSSEHPACHRPCAQFKSTSVVSQNALCKSAMTLPPMPILVDWNTHPGAADLLAPHGSSASGPTPQLVETTQIFLRLCQFLLEDFRPRDLGSSVAIRFFTRTMNASTPAIRLSTGGIEARCRPVPDW